MSGFVEVVLAFLRRCFLKDEADGAEEGVFDPCPYFSQFMVDLREHVFSRVEIGRVFGQEDEFSARPSDGLSGGLAVVVPRIVDHHNVA